MKFIDFTDFPNFYDLLTEDVNVHRLRSNYEVFSYKKGDNNFQNLIQNRGNEIFNIFQIAYNNDFKSAKKAKDLFKSSVLITVVYAHNNRDDQILAVACYREVPRDAYKCKGYAGNITYSKTQAKEAVQRLVLYEIDNILTIRFWVEVSGVMEHYFKKLGGYPIPSDIAIELIKKATKGKVVCTKIDNYHFNHPFGFGELVKCVFGFPDKETLNKCIESSTDKIKTYKDYEEFRQAILHDRTLFENYDIPPDVMRAQRIFLWFEEYYSASLIEDLTPQMFEDLRIAIEIVNDYSKIEKLSYLISLKEYGEELLGISILKANKFDI